MPAMGSHGGGTAPGQTQLLASYGITEAAVGAPIRASMDVVQVGEHPLGGPLYLDRHAAAADHIGVVARVKPHTNFHGSVESGLCKMMLIGLGKHVGALAYHQALLRYPWDKFVRAAVPPLLERTTVRFGLATVENARDETGKIAGVLPQDFFHTEAELLELARRWMPSLPFDHADLVIIDEIGKDISGAGMDTNVIGRKTEGDHRDLPPRAIKRIYARGLSAHTHGNATGIGFADFTSDRLVAEMDYQATIINCLTSNRPEGAAIPVHFPTDRQVIETALRTAGVGDFSLAQFQRIQNTLRLEELFVSSTYDLEKSANPLEIVARQPLRFDANGNLPRWPARARV